MNPLSCCSSCSGDSGTGLNKLFAMSNYVPATPGYDQTYSMPDFKPMGVAGPLMGQNVARPYPGAPGPVFADQGNPNFPRSDGNAQPFYQLSKVMPAVNPLGRQVETGYPDRVNPMGSYMSSGNPNIFNPLGAYSDTGNPNIFNPLGAYPSTSRPTGITPVGENLPAHIGHPERIGDGIGSSVQSLGFMV